MRSGEEQKWYDLADAIHGGIEDCLTKTQLSEVDLYEFVRMACGSLLRQERFENPFHGKASETPLNQLYTLMQHAMEYEGTIAMIPLQMSLYKGGQLTLREFIDYLRDSALMVAGFEPEVQGERADMEELGGLEDQFNSLLDKVEDHADNEEYQEAIIVLDEAFSLAEKEPLLFYDRATMYNNRAYYNFCLGNFEEALSDCKIALEDTEEGFFYHTKAEILHGMKRSDEALEAINKAIEMESTPDKIEFREEILRSR